MKSTQLKEIVNKYVDERYFDKEKIFKYLSLHEVVGNEIFGYCTKENQGEDRKVNVTSLLDREAGYIPLPIESFVKRIPFYFYVADYKEHRVGDLGCIISGFYSAKRKNAVNLNIESIYIILEYMFYQHGLPLDIIFQYTVDQTNYVSQHDIFINWYHYLQLCEKLNHNDLTPNRFISSYNELLERCSLPPIVYEIGYIDVCDMFWRSGNTIQFEGTFPCDDNGKPIMKWIGLKVKNPGEITCNCKKSERGRLCIKLLPKTMIHALNIYNGSNETEDAWHQIYAGPQNMQFDCEAIRNAREDLKYTQKQVAEAIGASVRTYQKWESGETTPDGHYLLRILNWLDLPDVQDVTRYTE